jgi:hypothetical protein
MVTVTLVEIEANVKINKCSSDRATAHSGGLGPFDFFSFFLLIFANKMSVNALISSSRFRPVPLMIRF